MANISTIKNLIDCGGNSVLGSGTKGCRPFLAKVQTLWLLPSGFTFDPDRELDEEYVRELQVAGNLVVVSGIRAFTDESQDNTTEELEDGTQSVTRLGLYQFQANFINGLYFNTFLNSISGFSNYDIMFIDRLGSILGTESLSGSLKGFTTGMIQAQKLVWSTDTTVGREGLQWQFLDRSELDRDYLLIQGAQLDFNPNRIDGINEVRLDGTVPVSGASTVVVKATTRQDGKNFTGAVLSNFLVTKNGVTVTPSSVAEVNGVYTFTLPVPALATNDVVEVQLYNSVVNKNVVTMDSTLFKSNLSRVVTV